MIQRICRVLDGEDGKCSKPMYLSTEKYLKHPQWYLSRYELKDEFTHEKRHFGFDQFSIS